MRGKEMFKKVLLFSFIFSSYIFADTQSVGAKIKMLSSVSKAERFKLINEIKRDLTKLNRTQRREAIGKLRSSIKAKHNQHQMKKQHQQGKQHSQNNQRKMDGTGPHNGKNKHGKPNK
jgi:microcystin degradation protein MlrC